MWKSISINKNQVEITTERAVLVNCPKKSSFAGYSFWHSSNLVKDGKHSEALALIFNDDVKFKLRRYGKNRNVLDEKTLGASDIITIFSCTDENIVAPKKETESYLHVTQPEKIDLGGIEVPECLKNS